MTGTLVAAQIAKSSGSNEINDIVLQTVKSTLNVVNPHQERFLRLISTWGLSYISKYDIILTIKGI